MAQSLEQPLLSTENDCHSNDKNVDVEPSKCNKLLRAIFIPLTYPFTACMKASCWKNRNLVPYQYELCMSFSTIFQLLIALVYGSGFKILFDVYNEKYENPNKMILFTLIYCVLLYIYATIQIIFIQRSKKIDLPLKSFKAGWIAHTVGFGIRELSFLIMDTYFSDAIQLSALYFFMSFAVSLSFIFFLSFIRKSLCFTIKTVKMRFKENSTQTNQMETDIVELGLTTSINNNEVADIETDEIKNHVEHELFDELLNEIDTDIWVIAMGYIFIELILYIISGEWIPLEESRLHEKKDFYAFIGGTATLLWITWMLFKILIAKCNVKRDQIVTRALHTSTLQNELRNSNCLTAFLIRISLRYFHSCEQIVMFINSFLAWGYGWILVSPAIAMSEWYSQLTAAFVCTVIGIVYFIVFTKLFTVRIKKLFKTDSFNEINLNKKQHKKLYGFLLGIHWFRKSFGLFIALPWEYTLETLWKIMNEKIGYAGYVVNPFLAMFLGMYFNFCGAAYVKIASTIEDQDASSNVVLYLQKYHQNIEKVMAQCTM